MKSTVKAAELRLRALVALGLLAGCKSSPDTDGLVVAPLLETPAGSAGAQEEVLDAAAAPHRITVDPRPPRGGNCTRQIDCLPPMANPAAPPYAHPYERCNPEPIGELGRFSPTETATHRATEPDVCCYVAYVQCGQTPAPRRDVIIRGRPLRDARGEKIVAPSADESGWARAEDGPRDEARAAFWAAEAADEHASVAEFARLSLALLAFGAPADLVEDAHRAALDEIEHARTCFSIASAYAGRAIGPGPLDVARAGADASLAALVHATLRDGCLGETAAAIELAERAEAEADPRVAAMARDEERHAELAWRILRFAMDRDERATRAVVARFLAEAEPEEPITRAVLDEIVRPCCLALLTSREPPRSPRGGGFAPEA